MRNSSGSSVIVSFLVSSVIGSSSGHSVIGSSLGSFFIGSALRSLVIESCSGSWVQVLGSTVESSVLFLRYAWFHKDKVPDYKIKYNSKFTLLPGGALTTIAINNAIIEHELWSSFTSYKYQKHHILYSQSAENSYEGVNFLSKCVDQLLSIKLFWHSYSLFVTRSHSQSDS